MEPRKKTVLMVDDSRLIIDRLREMLKDSENIERLYHAYSFAETMDLLRVVTPDILLLDINLPGTSGLEILRTVKRQFPSIVVIMLTNQSDRYYRKTCEELGADYFLDKFNDFQTIQELIKGKD